MFARRKAAQHIYWKQIFFLGMQRGEQGTNTRQKQQLHLNVSELALEFSENHRSRCVHGNAVRTREPISTRGEFGNAPADNRGASNPPLQTGVLTIDRRWGWTIFSNEKKGG
jgi:hypothetical protein